jgi:hypothetical protein
VELEFVVLLLVVVSLFEDVAEQLIIVPEPFVVVVAE